MADKKEIVLQKCKNAIDCGEPITDYGFYYDVIALLKEQEAREKNRLPYSPDSNVQWT